MATRPASPPTHSEAATRWIMRLETAISCALDAPECPVSAGTRTPASATSMATAAADEVSSSRQVIATSRASTACASRAWPWAIWVTKLRSTDPSSALESGSPISSDSVRMI